MKKLVGLVLAVCLTMALTGCKATDYKKAKELCATGEYVAAYEAFDALGDYKDSAEQATEARYLYAAELMESGDYPAASDLFSSLGEYKDSVNQAKEAQYLYASELSDSGEYSAASSAFNALGNYKDSVDRANRAMWLYAVELSDNKEYEKSITILKRLKGSGYTSAKKTLNDTYLAYGEALIGEGSYSKALTMLKNCTQDDRLKEILDSTAATLAAANNYKTA